MTSPPEIKILYLDNHLIAVYKPFGMLTQADRSGAPSLFDLTKSRLKRQFGKPGNVYLGLLHRLDRAVAGVVLFARTSKAAGRLSRQFREHSVRKIYRAAVLGTPENRQGELTAYLKKERSLKATVYPRPAKGARQARLTYRVLASFAGGCVLEVIPHTGRFHQIRAQLSFLGHPILGDVKYHAPRPLAGRRIALYAQKLVFRHPVSGEETVVESPEPPDWPPPAASFQPGN